MSKTGFEEVAEVLPERDRDGTYFWQGFAERIQHRLGGVPGIDGTGSFVDECLRAGANAVPAMRRNRLWQKGAPDTSDKQPRRVYELRIRLGLFYAASLRCLVQGVSRLRARCGEAEWHAVSEEGQSFSEFAAGQEGKVEVEWTNRAADFGATCMAIHVFLKAEEALLLTPELAQEVYNHVGPAGPSGLFGLMLVADGQAERPSVDVARVFLHALGEAVERKELKVNTRMGGHLFITPEFWVLTAPRGVDCMIEVIGTRRGARRHQLTRHEVYDALRAGGYLVGFAENDNTAPCVMKSRRWRKPAEMRGLCIAAGVLFSAREAPFFEGTVTIKEEKSDGSSQRRAGEIRKTHGA